MISQRPLWGKKRGRGKRKERKTLSEKRRSERERERERREGAEWKKEVTFFPRLAGTFEVGQGGEGGRGKN